MAWPPSLPLNASWADVVALQLQPWRDRGFIDVAAFLRATRSMRGLAHPPNAALVDTKNWQVKPIGAAWKPHHSTRATAVLNLFRAAQQHARTVGDPLPPIRFVLVVSDGHGATARGFNASGCTCKTEQTCCDPHINAPATEARGSELCDAVLPPFLRRERADDYKRPARHAVCGEH